MQPQAQCATCKTLLSLPPCINYVVLRMMDKFARRKKLPVKIFDGRQISAVVKEFYASIQIDVPVEDDGEAA